MTMVPELLCSEQDVPPSSSMEDFPLAAFDRSILHDWRVLDNMLTLQLSTIPSDEYLSQGNHIQPRMRKIVTTWMLDVCDEQRCEEQVFLVAVNLLDRFLSCTRIKRTQLQLSGCVCLLLASKLRQCSYLSVELLGDYTAGCVTSEEVRQWELLMVEKLKWDLCPVTAIDIVDVLLQQLNVVHCNVQLVRKHAAALVALAATESQFISTLPSDIAGAALTASIQGLSRCPLPNLLPLIDTIALKLKSSREVILPILYSIEKCMRKTSNASNSNGMPGSPASGDLVQDPPYNKVLDHDTLDPTSPSREGKKTPVDVMDIPF